jgi:hypothetical protein
MDEAILLCISVTSRKVSSEELKGSTIAVFGAFTPDSHMLWPRGAEVARHGLRGTV